MDDPRDTRWRAEALALDHGCLLAAARAAGEAGPDPQGLRTLAAVGACIPLDDDVGDGVEGVVAWGLAATDADLRWDAVHAAAALGLDGLAPEVEAVLDDASATEAVRARAAEALGDLFGAQDALTRLEQVSKQDDAFTVRRLATEAARSLKRGDDAPAHPLARLRALIRTGRATHEPSGPRADADALARAGLRVPPAWRLLLTDVCPGGRLALGQGALLVESPLTLAARAGDGGGNLAKLHEYVWARYVDNEKGAGVDEDQALRDYASRYDRGAIDRDAWNYGVLLFESAFRDEARRDEYLLRARDVLRAYRDHVGEDWDVVDDRLDELEAMIRDDGLTLPPGATPGAGVVVGSWDGLHELVVDLDRPGVFARDGGRTWPLRESLLWFLNDPHVAPPGEARALGVEPEVSALAMLEQAEAEFEAGHLKQASRLFGDALEDDASKQVLRRAAAFLERDDLTPLLAAQLLATIPLEGDKPSQDVVRVALQSVAPARALALVDAIAPHNEPQGPVALFVDAAAAIRRKSHAEVKERAKQLKTERGAAHIRTLRNPWYK